MPRAGATAAETEDDPWSAVPRRLAPAVGTATRAAPLRDTLAGGADGPQRRMAAVALRGSGKLISLGIHALPVRRVVAALGVPSNCLIRVCPQRGPDKETSAGNNTSDRRGRRAACAVEISRPAQAHPPFAARSVGRG